MQPHEGVLPPACRGGVTMQPVAGRVSTRVPTDAPAPAPDGLERDWPFQASEVPLWRRRLVLQAVLSRSRRRPPSAMLREVSPRPVWALYFSYAPDGALGDVQRFSLERLRDQGFAVLVVQAATAPGLVDADLLPRYADALYWKGLAGYDFSAYTLGLEAIARHSPGADVLVLNDSVFGPFADLRPMLRSAPWELTGFTASGKFENHVQSYAFLLKNLTPQRLRRLRTVFLPALALEDRDDVIFCQETRLARVASHSMSVGARWYGRDSDPTQAAPFELLREGFPFVKRSLLTARSAFKDKQAMADYVAEATGRCR